MINTIVNNHDNDLMQWILSVTEIRRRFELNVKNLTKHQTLNTSSFWPKIFEFLPCGVKYIRPNSR